MNAEVDERRAFLGNLLRRDLVGLSPIGGYPEVHSRPGTVGIAPASRRDAWRRPRRTAR